MLEDLLIPFMKSCNTSQHCIDGVVEIFEKVISQTRQEAVEEERKALADLLYNVLPTGEVNAFDLIKEIGKVVDYLNKEALSSSQKEK